MNIHQYYKACKDHDWYYDYSDDSSVWDKGSNERKVLIDLAREHGQHFVNVFNSLYKEKFPMATISPVDHKLL